MEPYPLDLSLIVVNYHSRAPLTALLASLGEHPIEAQHEVLVVDNSPDDGVAGWLASEHPAVRVIESGGNVGYARAVNAGIGAARGREILVINPDVRLEAQSVDRSLEYLRAHPEVGIVGVRLVNADGTDQHNARRFYTLTTICLRRTPLGRIWPNHPSMRDHLMLDDDLRSPGPVDWVTGAYMLVRREALDRVGRMDGRFFLYFEDVDWCQRMWDEGYEVHLLSDVCLHHEHQRTSAKLNRSLFHHLRSFFSYYDKWGALIYVARRLQGPWRRVAAVITDAVALNVAFLLAFFARRMLDAYFPEPLFGLVDYLPLIVFTNVVSAVTLAFLGRYSSRGQESDHRAFDSLRAAFLVVLVVMAGTYLSHLQTFSRAVLLMFVPLYLAALELTRRWGRRVLGGTDDRAASKRRVAVLGPWEEPHDFVAEDWVFAGCVGAAGCGRRELGAVADLDVVVDRYRIDELLVPCGIEPEDDLLESLRRVRDRGVEILCEDPWLPHGSGSGCARLGRWWRIWSPRKT